MNDYHDGLEKILTDIRDALQRLADYSIAGDSFPFYVKSVRNYRPMKDDGTVLILTKELLADLNYLVDGDTPDSGE